MDESCHKLKHEPGAAAAILKQLKLLSKVRPWANDDEDVQRAITYFGNQSKAGRMDYAARVANKEPIGSGVTEAAMAATGQRSRFLVNARLSLFIVDSLYDHSCLKDRTPTRDQIRWNHRFIDSLES